MEDWRLRGQEKYLTGAILQRTVFPDFWKRAYGEKNVFYQKIRNLAYQFVETMHRGEAFLEEERLGQFWHQHCVFCWEKAAVDKDCEFYCTEDFQHWVCKECFDDFQKQFRWSVKGEP